MFRLVFLVVVLSCVCGFLCVSSGLVWSVLVSSRLVSSHLGWSCRVLSGLDGMGLVLPCFALPCLALPCLALPCLAFSTRIRTRTQILTITLTITLETHVCPDFDLIGCRYSLQCRLHYTAIKTVFIRKSRTATESWRCPSG